MSWSQKALKEAQRVRAGRAAWDGADTRFDRLPTAVEVDPSATYLAYTTNNTIYGTQFKGHPDTPASRS